MHPAYLHQEGTSAKQGLPDLRACKATSRPEVRHTGAGQRSSWPGMCLGNALTKGDVTNNAMQKRWQGPSGRL